MIKLLLFLLTFLLFFLPVPIFGIYTQDKIFTKSIFNYSYSLYTLGISSDINKTVLGADGWMFLGNNYNNVKDKSNQSYKVVSEILQSNERFIADLYTMSSEANIKFKLMVAPNKHSIYGDKIGLASTEGSYSYYESNAEPVRSRFVSYLRGIKASIPYDLYFKSDTHWNNLGAFYGYQYFMNEILKDTYLKIPIKYEFQTIQHEAGDLAKFLNLNDNVSERNLLVLDATDQFLQRTNLTNNQTSKVGIQGNITNSAIKEPIKIVNNKALNKLKVLWLHDSFGNAMSPYMHLTFNEVTHQHFNNAFSNMMDFKKLIKDVDPDIIFLSVIERNSLDFGKYFDN